MPRKHSNARLRPKIPEKREFKPEPESKPPPKIELVKPEPVPKTQTGQTISHGGGYKHTWMTRKGVG